MNTQILYKQLTALLFLAAFLAQTFSGSFIIADYYTNRKAYTKNCVNKARPQMHCNGKCEMVKKMKLDDKKEQNTTRNTEIKYEVLFTKSSFPSVQIVITTSNILYPSIKASHAIDQISEIFHPPQVCSSRNSDI